MTKVTLRLPDDVARKLRSMCHKRGKTASELVHDWVAAWPETPKTTIGEILTEFINQRGSKA